MNQLSWDEARLTQRISASSDDPERRRPQCRKDPHSRHGIRPRARRGGPLAHSLETRRVSRDGCAPTETAERGRKRLGNPLVAARLTTWPLARLHERPADSQNPPLWPDVRGLSIAWHRRRSKGQPPDRTSRKPELDIEALLPEILRSGTGFWKMSSLGNLEEGEESSGVERNLSAKHVSHSGRHATLARSLPPLHGKPLSVSMSK